MRNPYRWIVALAVGVASTVDHSEAAEPVRTMPTDRAALRIADRSLDLRPGPGNEALEIRCEVTLASPGRYEAEPEVEEVTRRGFSHCPGSAQALTRKALDRSLADDTGYLEPFVVETDSRGRASFVAYFDGDDLSRFDRDGPWSFNCSFTRLAPRDSARAETLGPIEETFLAAQTRHWRRASFAQWKRSSNVEFRCGSTPEGIRAWNESARRRKERERQEAAKAPADSSR